MTEATLTDSTSAPQLGAEDKSGLAPFVAEFEAFVADGGRRGPGWLQRLRRRAMDRFTLLGFPTSREEDWRFTNIAPIAQRAFRRPRSVTTPAAAQLRSLTYRSLGWTELVFLNGRFVPQASFLGTLPPTLKLGSLRRALDVDGAILERFLGPSPTDRDAFTALNTALFEDGACLYVPEGVELAAPIHLLFVSDARAAGTALQPRNLLIAGRHSRVAIIETYASLAETSHLTNAVTEIVVGADACVEYIKIERESEAAFHIGSTLVRQARDSRFVSFAVTFGGAIARHNLDVAMEGPGVATTLNGLYMSRGRQLIDNHTSIVHAHPNCSSREVYKGILDGHSHAVFNGKVFVTPEAQKTDGKQTNRNLLLSDQARVDTKPQLEIFADDVKCTHGATVGRLDDHALFYLRSRGIGPELARKILTYAFAAEVLEEIPHASVRDGLEALVMSRLDVHPGI